MRVCRVCNKNLPRSSFYEKDALCKPCRSSTNKQDRRAKGILSRICRIEGQCFDFLPCSRCKNVKPKLEFGLYELRYHSLCKTCDREKMKEVYEQRPEKHIGSVRRWKQKNPEKCREYARRWSRENLEKRRVSNQNRRARKVLNGGSFTAKEWENLCKAHRNECAHCGTGDKLTIDHIIPISKGGTGRISNIQPLCKSCNSRKGARL